MTQYEMIAAELRRRIQAGELKPGDRVTIALPAGAPDKMASVVVVETN